MVLFRWIKLGAFLSVAAAFVVLLFLTVTLSGVLSQRPLVSPGVEETLSADDAPVMETLPLPQEIESVTTTASGGFLLLEWEGQLAVCTARREVITTLSRDPRTLPSREREALAHGIPVDTWEEMLSLIADYEG